MNEVSFAPQHNPNKTRVFTTGLPNDVLTFVFDALELARAHATEIRMCFPIEEELQFHAAHPS